MREKQICGQIYSPNGISTAFARLPGEVLHRVKEGVSSVSFLALRQDTEGKELEKGGLEAPAHDRLATLL